MIDFQRREVGTNLPSKVNEKMIVRTLYSRVGPDTYFGGNRIPYTWLILYNMKYYIAR